MFTCISTATIFVMSAHAYGEGGKPKNQEKSTVGMRENNKTNPGLNQGHRGERQALSLPGHPYYP